MLLTILALLCNAGAGAVAAAEPSNDVHVGTSATLQVDRLARAVNEEVTPSGDEVFSLNIDQPFDRGALQAAVSDVNSQGLGVFLQRQLLAVNVPGPDAPSQDVTDVAGTAATNGSVVTITIHPGDVGIDASWWVEVAASAVGALIYLAIRSVCIATLTLSVAGLPVAVVCASVGGFVGSLTRSLILMAADKKFADPQAWGKALLNAVIAAIGAGAWDAGVKAWATDTLPGVLQSFGQGVVEIGQAISRWSRTLGEFIRNGGETLRQIANDLPDLARNIRAASQPAAPPGWRLRLLPVGDSITEGFNSSSGNGYREALEGLEVGKGFPVDYVGSHRSGSMPQSRNEGWSSQEIGYIEDKTMANLKEYSPNVVTLLAGTNDIGHGKEAGAASRLMSFVEKIRAAVPDALVLVGALLPDESAATTAAHKRFNEQVQALLKPRDLAGVRFVSFDDLDPRAEMNGLHPNDAGYAKMATKWSAAIDYLLREGRVAQRAEISGDTGEHGSCEDKNAWYPQGTITLGPGPSSSDRVSLSDINGDGRDDYLVIHKDGSVQAYVNGGGSPNNWVWYDYGIVAGGVGAPGREIMFADINGDGRDDYLVVSDQGKVNLWLNGGGKPNDWIWLDQGKIADGVGKTIRQPEPNGPGGPVKINPYSLQFADINGDGRDDYIVSENDSGAGEAWLMIGDPFHPTLYPQGTVAFGAGSRGSAPQYANIDCAGRADYLRINTATNGVTAYRNNGAAPGGGYSWTELKDFATGDGTGSGTIIFADINGDGRDDYVNLTEGGALVNVYLRG